MWDIWLVVSCRKLILNLMHFGYKVLNEENVKAPKSKIKSKERPGEKYETSRWTPLLQDIAEVFLIYSQLTSSETDTTGNKDFVACP